MKCVSLAALLICGAAGKDLDQPPVQQVQGDFVPAGSPPGDDSATVVEHPDFEPYPDPEDFAHASLFEQFSAPEGELFEKWRVSHAKKADSVDEFSYVGKWAIEEPYLVPGFKGDKGLVLKTPAAHHAISHKFAEPLVVDDKPLVVQYETKFQDGLLCGGGYVKLLGQEDEESEFSNATPYVVMFGPDKCGSTDKVHLIIKRKTSGEWVEHHLMLPPRTQPGKISTLYTLILHPNDQTFEIRINGIVAKAGSLLDDKTFSPPFTPPAEIYDESDTKPDDWVDDEEIPDPDAVKPEDWDESAPFTIPDLEAEQPEDWLADEELYIVDPEAVKPANWDDEEDGEWIAPEVPNPKCLEVSGCGPWTPPEIPNPEYKGIWTADLVPNPEYKGEWEPRKIPNPDYFEDKTPAKLDPISGVGLELWTMQADILFDNFYIGQNIYEAELLGNATWGPKYYVEQKEMKANAPQPKPSKGYSYWDHFRAMPLEFLFVTFEDFVTQWRMSPMDTLRDQPVAAALVGGALLIGTTIFFGIINALLFAFGGKQLKAAKAKAVTTKETKEDAKQTEAPVASTSSASVSGATKAQKRKV